MAIEFDYFSNIKVGLQWQNVMLQILDGFPMLCVSMSPIMSIIIKFLPFYVSKFKVTCKNTLKCVTSDLKF